MLYDHHARLIKDSGITDDVAAQRGYFTATRAPDLRKLGFGASQALVPALVIPMYGVRVDECIGYQIRPDNPRVGSTGKPVKYETPAKMSVTLDVHPSMRHRLNDLSVPLIITEGMRKGDAAVSMLGLPAISLMGVYGFRGRNPTGGTTWLPDWEHVALKDHRKILLAFDSDVMYKPEVHAALGRLGAELVKRGADLFYIYLPQTEDGAKVGLDDFLATGNGIDDVLKHASHELRSAEPKAKPKPPRAKATPRSFVSVCNVYRKWLESPDTDALAAVLATVVANRAEGDPVWLLVIGPPSSGKTEFIGALSILEDVVQTSRLTVASFLSGSKRAEYATDATGGILIDMGKRGIMTNKDFGSILAMPHTERAETLQALRDIYDGVYLRQIGNEGGRTLSWEGHCGFIGGCTYDIDNHHAVISALGDRYIMIRLQLGDPVMQAIRAINGVGNEEAMRDELADAIAGLLDHTSNELPKLAEESEQRLAMLASLIVQCRSVVTRDTYHTREIEQVPPTEQPARLVKQLAKMVRGLLAIELDEREAWSITERIARDSMPEGRRRVIDIMAMAEAEAWTPEELGSRMNLPRTTTRRYLEDLTALEIVRRYRGTPERFALVESVRHEWPRRPES